MGTSTIVRVQRAFDCTAEAVYDAWLDPQLARRFWFATPPAGEVIRCVIEPSVNGKFTIVDRRPIEAGSDSAIDMEHTGRFLQLDRPRRIAFSFSLPQMQDHETAVIIDIEPQGDGCELTLRHDLGPADDESTEVLERAEHGWSVILENLGKVLKGG
jgi:uncharacterized protein YndB with AHSA1/START domain